MSRVYDIVVVDVFGCGGSAYPPQEFGPADHAHVLVGTLDALGVSPAHLAVNRAAGAPRTACARTLTSMHGLTIRWSLTGAPDGVEDALRGYVEATSHGRYSGRKDLRFKTWRMREGEWFEGCYVFETPAARETFEREFRAAVAGSPSSQIIGSAPALIEPCEIVAVAEGASGFIDSASFG